MFGSKTQRFFHFLPPFGFSAFREVIVSQFSGKTMGREKYFRVGLCPFWKRENIFRSRNK